MSAFFRALSAALATLAFFSSAHVAAESLNVNTPDHVLLGVPFAVEHNLPENAELQVTLDGTLVYDGPATEELKLTIDDDGSLLRFQSTLAGEAQSVENQVLVHNPWVSLLPPLLAIAFALIFREVVLALCAGVLAGAFLTSNHHPILALTSGVSDHVVGAVADRDHASILVFSLTLGGMLAVMTKAGGATGIAQLVTKRATTAKRGLLSTWLLGIVVFFDDYANSLLVGSSMRPITDKLRVSREKLSFLVDATAAPVSSIALVSSWIGVEVAYIAEELEGLGMERDAYLVFLETLPYRFYPILMLLFGLTIVLMGRDFGPMYKAEKRARETGQLLAEGAKPASHFDEIPDVEPRAWIGFLSIGTVVLVALLGMFLTGRASVLEEGRDVTLRAAFGSANSIDSLLWAACAGSIVALVAGLATKTFKVKEGLEAWFDGVRSMVLACAILILAWALGGLCKDLHTADFVVQSVGSALDPRFIPAIVFLLAAAVSFATGSSWGTMAILFPLVIPLAATAADDTILLGAISSILAGSVFGDHCSPISDTTILSSMAASADHIDHVRTQLPYALFVAFVSIVVGELGTAFGLYPAPIALLLGAVLIVLGVRFIGKPVDTEAEGDARKRRDVEFSA